MFTLSTFYKSREWETLRAQLMLERVNDKGELICEDCGKPITKRYDCIAHHEIELTDDNVNDFEISLNPEFIRLIHFKCHNKRHHRYGGFNRSVYLVYGSPCSGKTTWVESVSGADDIILDIDKIWECISTADRYHKPSRLKANVFGVRDCLLDQIRTRTGNWYNAFVIGTYPLRTDRDRLCGLLRAEPVFIDETQEVCLERATNPAWKDYINNWFDAFVP